MRELTVFSRRGCHLCEVLIEELEPLCRRAGVRVQVADVDHRPEWVASYGQRVPVVCCGEREVSGYPLDRRAVLAWLQADTA